jgi:hypothetical protein
MGPVATVVVVAGVVVVVVCAVVVVAGVAIVDAGWCEVVVATTPRPQAAVKRTSAMNPAIGEGILRS